MPWLWYAAPVFFVVLFLLNARVPETRRLAEVEAWRKRIARRLKNVTEKAGYRSGKQSKKEVVGPGPKLVAPPSALSRLLPEVGGGARVGSYELVPRLAYLCLVESDPLNGSDHTTVLGKLDKKYPRFVARPLPIVEGARIPNTGIQFKKATEFTDEFLVEGEEASKKAIIKFLNRTARQALLDLPRAWLRVDGDAMALSVYGPVDADELEELVATADVLFADYGAGGGPSLVGDDEDDEDDDEEEDDEDAEEGEESPANA